VKGIISPAVRDCVLGLVVLMAWIFPAEAAPFPSSTAIPSQASIRTLWYPGLEPKNMEELRLRDLEDAAGILRWDWGMAIPAGKKLVIRLYGGDSGATPLIWSDYTFAVNGPLAPSFASRISLVRHSTDHDRTTQLSFEISAQHEGGINESEPSFPPIDIGPGWDGDRGGTGRTGGVMPGTIWEEHLGPKDAPNRLDYKLDVTVAPADPEAKPGWIVTVPRKTVPRSSRFFDKKT
jgi:hypothetical protein